MIFICDARVSNEIQFVLVKLCCTDDMQSLPNIFFASSFLNQEGFQNIFKFVPFRGRITVLCVKLWNLKHPLEHLLCFRQAIAAYYSPSFLLQHFKATFNSVFVVCRVSNGVFAQEENRLLFNWIAHGPPVPFGSQDSSI